MSRGQSRRRFLEHGGIAAACLLSGRASLARQTEAGASPPPIDQILPARAVTQGPLAHFVGYYDKCPWNASGRYLVAHQIAFCDRQPTPGEPLTIGVIDLHDGDRYRPLDETTAWSWQQGAMLQWLGSNPEREIIYNTLDDASQTYQATIRDVETGEVRRLPRPIECLSPDGTMATSLPFDRLNRLRPGYGYMAVPERQSGNPAPDDDGLWLLDVTGKREPRLVFSLAEAAAFQPDERFEGAEHWFNHVVFSPGGRWITFLHRWKSPATKSWETRMLVSRPDGSQRAIVWDDGMVSHFDWKDDRSILAWAHSNRDGNHFFLSDVETGLVSILAPDVLDRDGHCSFAPDRRFVLNDTYPDEDRLQTLMLLRLADNQRINIGRYLEPREFTGPFRCDLHPRFNRDGTQVCVDSTHAGRMRQVYVVDVSSLTGPTG